MGPRKWLAWKLVQIAHLLHDPEWYEHISIDSPSGETYHIGVNGDEYGSGITFTSGIRWDAGIECETADVEGWQFTWREPVRG